MAISPAGPDRRDLLVARIALGAAAVGVAWLVWRTPAVRKAVTRGAKFVLVTWLPAYVASHVRGAWADAALAPPPEPTGPTSSGDASRTSAPHAPAVAAFTPPAGSE
jgi:hypothetical protein